MKDPEPRVFVVDDDHSVRTSLANLLARRTMPSRSLPTRPNTWRGRAARGPSVPRARPATAGSRWPGASTAARRRKAE